MYQHEYHTCSFGLCLQHSLHCKILPLKTMSQRTSILVNTSTVVDQTFENKPTKMAKRRVQFSSCLVQKERRSQQRFQPLSVETRSIGSNDFGSSLPSTWYSQKELKGFRLEVKALVDAHNEVNGPAGERRNHNIRGLEMFMSRTRKELQRHFIRTILETQRRIKKHQRKQKHVKHRKSIPEEEGSLMLQKTAAKYSEYARDRAKEVASRDAIDSRLYQQEGALLPKKRSTPKRKPSQSLQTSMITSMASQYSNLIPRA